MARSVVIAGGGIGGLTAALALRARGVGAEVYEAQGDQRELGAGLTLWPNAMSVLDRVGVGARVRQVSEPAPGAGIRTPSGRWLARMSTSAYTAALGGPAYVVHRGELLDVLAGELGRDRIVLHATCTGVEAGARGRAAIVTADGTQVEADCVVGADGAASTVASWMHPAVRPRYAGWTAWRGVADLGDRELPAGAWAETWGRGERFGALPMSRARVYWYACANRPEGERAGSPGAEHALVRDRFARWHDPIGALIEATAPESVLRHDVYDRDPLPSWSRGSVTVLGDAAHPTQPNLGQGACQAIEEAEVLASCIAAGDDVAAALSRYEATRKARADDLVRLSRRLGKLAQADSAAVCAVRDLGTALTPQWATLRRLRSYARTTRAPAVSG